MGTGIIFNYIPGAGLTAPGFFFEANSGGQYQSITRLVLLGYKSSAGALPLNTPTPVSSQDQADYLAGPGTMLREMFRLAAANAPAQPIWLLATSDPGTPLAKWTMTVNSVPAPGQGTFEIAGRQMAIAVSAADTTATVAASIAAAINGFYDTLTGAMVPVTAAVGSGGSANVVTVTAVHPGIGLVSSFLIDFYVSPASSNVLGAVVGSTPVLAVTQTVEGTGIPPSLANALASLGDDPADFIVSPFADTASLEAASATLNDTSGRWAWDRQSYGHYWSVNEANFSAQTTFGLTLNDRHLTIQDAFPNNVSPIWEWIAGICGVVAPWLSDTVTGNVSRNQTGTIVQGLRGPRDRSTLRNYSARNTLLNSGISTFNMDVSGNVTVDKIVTTYRVGISGQPDTVFRDIQSIYQAAGSLAYIRAIVEQAHGRKAFAADNPGNLGAISTPSDIKSTFIAAYTQLVLQGVLQDVDGFSRNIVVQANAENPNRCDVLAPLERVNPLDILATNATFYQQYPANF